MPRTKQSLFQIEKGLPPALKGEKVVFEQYLKTKMGNAEASRLYANGAFYKAYLAYNQSVIRDDIFWHNIGVISQNGIDKIEAISKHSLVDYINNGPYKRDNDALEHAYWYFYFDEAIFVKSQVRKWRDLDRFVKEIEEVMEDDLTLKHLIRKE